MQIQRNASRKHGLQAQPRQRCSSCQDSNTLGFQSEACLGYDCRLTIPLVLEGRIGPSRRPPQCLRAAQPCEVFQYITIIKTPVLNNLLQDEVFWISEITHFLTRQAYWLHLLVGRRKRRQSQVQNVLKFLFTCIARHDTPALKVFFSCNASENQSRVKWY